MKRARPAAGGAPDHSGFEHGRKLCTGGGQPLRIEAVGTRIDGRPSWDQFDDLSTMAMRDAAARFSARILAAKHATPELAIASAYEQALGRPPPTSEAARMKAFLDGNGAPQK